MQAVALDLRDAVVFAPPELDKRGQKAVAMLVEEVEKRTQRRWPVTNQWPADGKPVIAVGPASALEGKFTAGAAMAAEGYHLESSANSVIVAGSDTRGILFGAGRLLRELRMRPGAVSLADNLRIASAPRYPIRGHQMGNRPLNNAVDAWTVEQWEQHIRDLAVFGTNAIEFIPPGAGDETTPHYRLPPLEMMARVSRVLDDYGLDVWIWYPALEKDYSDAATVERALNEWTTVYKALPRIDAIFVPGGDPGHTHPKHLLPFLEKQAQALHRSHPKAGIWLSPQGFDLAWMEDLYSALNREPSWLAGLVYGPGVRVSMEELRAKAPRRYPIRLYPDITHTVRAQFAVPDWDPAFAMTELREPINPRPFAQAKIFKTWNALTAGFITYSDGVNDDVNKIVWSALGWDPGSSIPAIVREYGRYFIGDAPGGDFALLTMALERNWQGPIATNASIDTTLLQWRSLERSAPPDVLGNWRFQMGLYRAYFDAYVRTRLLRERVVLDRARLELEAAPNAGSEAAIEQALKTLNGYSANPPALDVRARLFELGGALYQSIGLQLSQRYGGYRRDRATSLDSLDAPITNLHWWKQRLAAIRGLTAEPERQREIASLIHWTDPGPGGFYDDLGHPERQPHLLKEGDSYPTSANPRPGDPITWSTHASSGIGRPMRMRYTGLDRTAQYRIRVVYAGENVSQEQGIRLVADGAIVVHPYMKKPLPVRPVEFDVPVEATLDGEVTFAWDREVTPSGRIRGAQVAEVWLIRK
ncbi:MAG: hypothetical protein ACKV22_15560 [Bryobacteraceae bacterium]